MWFKCLFCILVAVANAREFVRPNGGVAIENFNPPKPALYYFDVPSVSVSTEPTSRPGVNHKVMQEYLLWLDVNRLLYPFRFVANLSTEGYEPYGGWEQGNDRSHFTGHYLSALAQMYAATGDVRFAKKAEQLMHGIRECQLAIGSGYVAGIPHWFYDDMFAFVEQGYFCDPAHAYDYPNGVPFYVSHKLLAGLLDWNTYGADAESQKLALTIAIHLADHLDNLVMACINQNTTYMWNVVMNLEFGGMSESLYYLYNLTGEMRYYRTGVWFEKPCFIGPLAQRHEIMTGLHGNTHVPQVIGDAVRYQIDGNAQSRIVTEYFWDTIVHTRTYATNGNTNYEHWQTPGILSNELSSYNQETCVSYNMLKLSRHLLQWTADAKYADFAHKLFWNGIMGTMDPSSYGLLLYYTPLGPGGVKNFGTPDASFWCCYGTGVENWSGMGSYLYFHDVQGNLYIQNFFPSTLTLSPGVTLTLDSLFPDQTNVSLTFSIAKNSTGFNKAINILVPSWVSGTPQFMLNGRLLSITAQPGSWATLPAQSYNTGDTLAFVYDMELYAVPTPDNNQVFAVAYGPVVLVALTADWCLGVDPTQHAPSTWLKRTSTTSLRFETYGSLVRPLQFMPLDEVYDLTYSLYVASCAAQPQPPTHGVKAPNPSYKGELKCKTCGF